MDAPFRIVFLREEVPEPDLMAVLEPATENTAEQQRAHGRSDEPVERPELFGAWRRMATPPA
jgi:hypothetical protein